MSSNMYGFTCDIKWGGRYYNVQIVYEGTFEDSEDSLLDATVGWETNDPVVLAQYELQHRDWSQDWRRCRIGVWSCYGGWSDSDNTGDLPTRSIQPRENEILEIIAAGKAENIKFGWDT